jgi:hypothetical protein
MAYCVLSKDGDFFAVKGTKTKIQSLVKKGYVGIAVSETKEKAEGIIMGIKAHSVVEKFAGHLPHDMKVAFKSEIAQLATQMYNEIVK